jgi:hypothetical protein
MLRTLRRKNKIALIPPPKSVVEQVQDTLAQAIREEANLAQHIEELNNDLFAKKQHREQTERIAKGLDAVLTGESK